MKDLLLNLDALDDGVQPLEADLSREFVDELLREDPPTEFVAGGSAHLRGDVTKMGKGVLVRATFAVPLKGQCKRCLKPVPTDEKVELVRSYVPRPAKAGPAGEREGRKAKKPPRDDRDEEGTAASFDPQNVDEEEYTGREIDLRPALREQILLSVPPSPTCDEDCKGLCASCGKDLNEGDCGCVRTAVDPRWAALQGLQLDTKE